MEDAMNKISAIWKQTVSLCKNIFLPALFFGIAALVFYGNDEFGRNALLFLHIGFYGCSFLSLFILLYFNQSKPAFYLITLLLSYILINSLKIKYGADIESMPHAHNLFVFLPFNLLLFSFLPERRLLSGRNLILFLFLLADYAIAERILSGISIDYNFETGVSSLPGDMSLLLFLCLLAASCAKAVQSGSILDSALFFSNLNIFAATYYFASPTALALFYAVSGIIMLIAVIYHIYDHTYRDALTGLMSRKAYVIQSANFPLKYSIGIISVDDYDKLAYMFGRRQRNALVKMIAQKLRNAEPDENIYRYSEEEFVIIFKNEIKKGAYQRMENLRRIIASASFCLPGRSKIVKLTVSGSVSEKKRSDANSVEVLVRAHKVLQKALSFSHNITSQA